MLHFVERQQKFYMVSWQGSFERRDLRKKKMMMEYVNDKFALKSHAIKGSDYYMGSGSGLDQVMESLDSVQYYSKTSPKCVQAFGIQSSEHHSRMERSSPCGDQHG